MTLSEMGKQYICQNFGDAGLCCTNTGLSWFYTVGGANTNETGGTAQIVSRLASGLIDSLTMVTPPRGTFTQAELNAANGVPVTFSDAQEITLHDEPTEDQWCFIPCDTHTDQTTCESYGCYWYNGSCHTDAPTADDLDNSTDCLDYGFYWYRNDCHAVDQLELCYYIDAHWPLTLADVFEIVDAYLFQVPPAGWTFTPTLANVLGVVDYYLGFDGDVGTGCDIFGT